MASAYQTALRLLARREHAAFELKQKLLRYFEVDEVDAALVQLQQKGWQDEGRYVQQLVASKAKRGDGPIKIAAHLRTRGVEKTLIESALMRVDWAEELSLLIQQRFSDKPIKTQAERAKRMRFLQQRGFTWEQIQAAEK